MAWRAVLNRPPPWEGCCDTHDRFYAQGGSVWRRLVVDAALRRCVVRNGSPAWAWAMWVAVRLGGWPFWPVSWRWGFELPYGCGYRR